ncbi:hypothetical protein JOF35_008543 [Streptomyces demainii]|uniref:Uncharacterized protein n=1 Tax=Streptomyces demainii TaxID=588122 RepID=A0ABT9L7D7_9ACTN|nr:hypothetical protein [Streptomyces demainii]
MREPAVSGGTGRTGHGRDLRPRAASGRHEDDRGQHLTISETGVGHRPADGSAPPEPPAGTTPICCRLVCAALICGSVSAGSRVRSRVLAACRPLGTWPPPAPAWLGVRGRQRRQRAPRGTPARRRLHTRRPPDPPGLGARAGLPRPVAPCPCGPFGLGCVRSDPVAAASAAGSGPAGICRTAVQGSAPAPSGHRYSYNTARPHVPAGAARSAGTAPGRPSTAAHNGSPSASRPVRKRQAPPARSATAESSVPTWGAHRCSARVTTGNAMRWSAGTDRARRHRSVARGTTSSRSATERPCCSHSAKAGCEQHFRSRPRRRRGD